MLYYFHCFLLSSCVCQLLIKFTMMILTELRLHAYKITSGTVLEKTSSSAIAERTRCRVGQLWPKVENDILQII